ncbi:MAG: hypothetical protein MHM6MM_001244 [Cercozoa sp. M6MM]
MTKNHIRVPQPEKQENGDVHVTEGKATALIGHGDEVFYNPVQIVNRDLSITLLNTYSEMRRQEWQQEKEMTPAERRRAARKLAKHTFGDVEKLAAAAEERAAASEFPGLRVLEALSASGVRSMRYWKEIRGLQHLTVNDMDPAAVESIKKNVEMNSLPTELVVPSLADANLAMYQTMARDAKKFDVIDLDPFGSAAPFVDAAIRTVSEGGVLLVTCTDMSVLCGNNAETALSLYGGVPLKGRDYCQEFALRLLLHLLAQTAARYDRYIEPLASFRVDFYSRVFIRVRTSPSITKQWSTKSARVLQARQGPAFYLEHAVRSETRGTSTLYRPGYAHEFAKCPETDQNFTLGGPIWTGPLHNKDFLTKALEMLDNKEVFEEGQLGAKVRVKALLTLAHQEVDSVLYYTTSGMARAFGCPSLPHAKLASALINAGFQYSRSHADVDAFKTDATTADIFDIYRQWSKQHLKQESPETAEKKKKESKKNKKKSHLVEFRRKLLEKPPLRELDWSKVDLPDLQVPLFLPNPQENWGPKARGKSHTQQAQDARNHQRKKKVRALTGDSARTQISLCA